MSTNERPSGFAQGRNSESTERSEGSGGGSEGSRSRNPLMFSAPSTPSEFRFAVEREDQLESV